MFDDGVVDAHCHRVESMHCMVVAIRIMFVMKGIHGIVQPFFTLNSARLKIRWLKLFSSGNKMPMINADCLAETKLG